MSLFNELGRKVERFKQRATDAAEGRPDFRCAACEAGFDEDHSPCPDCGADAVERVVSG